MWDIIRDPRCECTSHKQLVAIGKDLLVKLRALPSATVHSPTTARTSGCCKSHPSPHSASSASQPAAAASDERRICTACSGSFPRASYSNNQWNKGAGVGRCKTCIDHEQDSYSSRGSGSPFRRADPKVTPLSTYEMQQRDLLCQEGYSAADYTRLRRKRCMWCNQPGCVECALAEGDDPVTNHSADYYIYPGGGDYY